MRTIDLTEKTVFITGASSGIGRELSRYFAMEKANLIMASLPSEKEVLDQWAGELSRTFGVKARIVTEDLSSQNGPYNVYRKVTAMARPVDVLVNNAGIISFGLFHQLSLEAQERIVAVNLRAYMVLMRLFLADMVERNQGHVFNVVSVSAFVPTPRHTVYGASKAFVQSLSEGVDEELKGTGVTVFTLNPGYTDTPLLQTEGFPGQLRFFRFAGKSNPADIAQKGVKAFKKGKHVYIPELHLWLLFMVLSRFAPRRIINLISALMVRES